MTTDHPHECDLCHAAEGKWFWGDWMICQVCISRIMADLEAHHPDDDDRKDGTG